MAGSKKKVYLLLISLGGVALFVDRCVLGGASPQPVSAEENDSNETDKAPSHRKPSPRPPPDSAANKPPAGAAAAPATPGTMSIPELPFPRHLTPYDPGVPLRDIFLRIDPAASPDQPTHNHGAAGKSPERIGRSNFTTKHKLDALMIQDRLRIAILDGRWMRIGESVDGCTLQSIEGESVLFHCHDGDIELFLTAGKSGG